MLIIVNNRALSIKQRWVLIFLLFKFLKLGGKKLVWVYAQSRPTLWDPMDYSLPDSSVHGIFQAEVLELVVISSSRGSSWSKDRTPISCVSCIGKWILYHCTIWEVQWLSYCYLYPERIHISFSQVSGTTSNIGLSESNFWACNFSGPHRWIKTIPCECDFIMVFWNLVL